MKKIVLALIFFNCIIYIFPDSIKNNFSFYSVDSDTTSSATKNVDLNLFKANIAHGILASLAYIDMIALSIVGQTMLVDNFAGDNLADTVTGASGKVSTYAALRISHILLASSTYLLLASSFITSYITLGIKIKKGFAINYPHFVSSIVTSAFYILEIASMIITGVSYAMHNPNEKYIGLAHAILSYAFLASFTVTLITLPLGRKYKKVIKRSA